MKVVVTGGWGYIGSAIVRSLEEAGHTVVVLDLVRPARSGGRLALTGDIGDLEFVTSALRRHGDTAVVIHLAARIDVSSSVGEAEDTYLGNVNASLVLFKAMRDTGIFSLIYASSASVYGSVDSPLVHEDSALLPTSPYGLSKRVVEDVARSLAECGHIRVLMLRYFNPIGVDDEYGVGRYLSRPGLMPGLLRACTSGEALPVYGVDHATPDGSAVRDFFSVMELAGAHVKAVDVLRVVPLGTVQVLNLGSGRPTSVLEMARTVSEIFGCRIDLDIRTRRAQEVSSCFADVRRPTQCSDGSLWIRCVM